MNRRGFIGRFLALASAATVTKSLSHEVTDRPVTKDIPVRLDGNGISGSDYLTGNEESISFYTRDPVREHYADDLAAAIAKQIDDNVYDMLSRS